MSDACEESKSDRIPATTKLVTSNGDTIPADGLKEQVPTGGTPSRVNTPIKVPYAKVCHLSITDEDVGLFVTLSYTIYVTVGANP